MNEGTVVHRERKRMRQRGIVVQMERENKEGEVRKKESLFGSITAVLFDGRDISRNTKSDAQGSFFSHVLPFSATAILVPRLALY